MREENRTESISFPSTSGPSTWLVSQLVSALDDGVASVTEVDRSRSR